ncbi:MAG: Uncharacterised protein [SAR116 cluster bacterium]|nr:MAG: Uncharacterised protein [SAR116 cluster bacterium]
MAHFCFIGQRKQICVGFLTCQGGKAQRGDEFAGRTRHHAGYTNILVLKAARNFQRFIGGNTAANDQQDALAVAGCVVTLCGRELLPGDFKARRVNAVSSCPKRFTNRAHRALWQLVPCQIIADRTCTHTQQCLQCCTSAKRRYDGLHIMIFHKFTIN